MATTTSTAPTTAVCTVTYAFDFGWVEVRNVDSGKKMTLDMTGRDPLAFRGAQADLWVMFGNLDNGITIPLTARQLNTFVRMCRNQPEPGDNAAPISERNATQIVFRETLRTSVSRDNKSSDEVKIETLQRVVSKVSNDNYVMLVYDIPTAKNDVCPNPSNLLWRHGFRINLSCWVIPSKRLETRTIKAIFQTWDANNIVYHTVPYAEHAMEQIRKIARLNLDQEIRRVHTSLIEKIAAADEQLQQAIKAEDATPNATEAADAYRDNRVRSAIKLAAEQLDAAISCAEAFDATEDVASLLDGLRNAIRSQVSTFNIKARQTGRKLAKV